MVAEPSKDDELARQHEDYSGRIDNLLIEVQDRAYKRGVENSEEEIDILRSRLEICDAVMRDVLKFVPVGTRENIALRGAIIQSSQLPNHLTRHDEPLSIMETALEAILTESKRPEYGFEDRIIDLAEKALRTARQA